MITVVRTPVEHRPDAGGSGGSMQGDATVAAGRRRAGRRLLLASVLATAAVAMAGCSEPEPEAGPSTTDLPSVTDSVEPTEGDGRTVISRFAGEQWFLGEVPTPKAADPALPPVLVGFTNVDSGPVGALPELHDAADAAVAFMNAELGGAGGRPVELVPCILSNPLSADESQACGRQFVDAGVVAVLGGIGLSNGPMIDVLEQNQVPYVGGIPLNQPEMTSPISFQFSGGSPGAFTAFAQDAVEAKGSRRVAVLFAEYPAIQDAAVNYGAAVARDLGAEVVEVPFPMVSQDYSAAAQKAAESDPDAIFVGAADLACAPIMQALADLDSGAQLYMVGACADQRQIAKVGVDRVLGTRFNVEGRIDQGDGLADTELYSLAMERYAPETSPRSAATVVFRSAMNLWAVLERLGPDATSGEVLQAFRTSVDVPSFDGHPYTCDGSPIPALPSMCAPQEVIAELTGPDQFREASDGWIDVPAVLAAAGVAQQPPG
jgi:branched-chain amino acid transport system substrate-binding protein